MMFQIKSKISDVEISKQKQQKSSEEIRFNYKTNLNRFL